MEKEGKFPESMVLCVFVYRTEQGRKAGGGAIIMCLNLEAFFFLFLLSSYLLSSKDLKKIHSIGYI